MTDGWGELIQSVCFLATVCIFCLWLTRLGNQLNSLTSRVIDLEQGRSGRGRR